MQKLITGMLIGAVVTLFARHALDAPLSYAATTATPSNTPTSLDSENCSREQEAANKRIIEMYDPKPEALKIMHPDYIQHDPEVRRFAELNGTHGSAVFALQREALARLGMNGPKPHAAGNPHYMMIAECDTVVVVRQEFEPDPQYPGKTYEAFSFDVWRMRNGQLYEHWDGARIPEPVPEYLTTPVRDIKPLKGSSPASPPK